MLPGLALAIALASGPQINPVAFSNQTLSDSNAVAAPATATISYNTDRTVKNQASTTLENWLLAGYATSNYQIRATVQSGSTPTGDLTNSWLGLSANRSWSVSESGGVAGSTTTTLLIEIRDAAAPNTLRGSATVTLTADSSQIIVNRSISASGYSGTYVAATTSNVTVAASGNPVTLRMQGSFDHVTTSSSGGTTQSAKWQRSPAGANTWTDIGTVQSGTTNETLVDVETQQWGYENAPFDYTVQDSPVAGNYDYRIVVRRASGTKSAYISGTATVSYY